MLAAVPVSPHGKGHLPLPLRSHPLAFCEAGGKGELDTVWTSPWGAWGQGRGVHWRLRSKEGDRPDKSSKMEPTALGRVNGWRSPRVIDLEALGPPDGEGLPSCLRQGPITNLCKGSSRATPQAQQDWDPWVRLPCCHDNHGCSVQDTVRLSQKLPDLRLRSSGPVIQPRHGHDPCPQPEGCGCT